LKLLIKPKSIQYFEDMDIFKDYLVVYMKEKLAPCVLLYNLKTGEIKKFHLEIPGEVQPGLNKVRVVFILGLFSKISYI
jgi:protease II